MPMKPVVQLRGVNKVYRRGSEEIYALRNIDLEFYQGDFVSIIGPSGSGKTTLLNLIGCLDTASSGSVRIDGAETSAMREDDLVKIRREKIGFVFQQFYLIPGLTVRENISLPLVFSRKKPEKDRMDAILEDVGLSGRANHKPNQLSGGEMQRVAIARALVNEPRIILADEPTGNLDLNNKKKVFELLKSLNGQGLTVVLVTHDIQVAAESKTVLAITDGNLGLIADANEYFCKVS
ncbi:MAG: ABC transporter ATP-binding protein [Syntrophobacteraceae bacterium]